MQNPVALRRHGEPQPDVALVEGLPSGRLPGPAEIAPIVEVADTSLAYDRERKLPLYAEAGIPEVWIVNLADNVVGGVRRAYLGELRDGFANARR